MKKWKVVLPIFLCAAFLLVSLFPCAAAASGPVIRVGNVLGRRGNQVIVDVSIDTVEGAASGSFNIVYDRSALTLVSAEAGEVLAGATCVINENYSSNSVRLTFAGSAPLARDGILMRLTFQIGRYATLGSHPVTAENVKLSDIEGRAISAAAEAGGVTVQSVSLAAADVECAPGGDVQMDVALVGDFAPCGGEFEVRYVPSLLTAASVTTEQELGGVPISLTYSTDINTGRIKISWAAAEPVGALGKLCTLHFATGTDASGRTQVSISNMYFFDEDGNQAETYSPTSGTVTFQNVPEAEPMLYITGGYRNADGTSTVQIIADGPNLICGGEFKLIYDASKCVLESIDTKASAAVTNPETADAARGIVAAAWGHSGPSTEREVVMEVTFRLASQEPAALRLEDVFLTGLDGSSFPDVRVCYGKAGIGTQLQAPSVDVSRVGGNWRIDGLVFSAVYGNVDEPVQATPIFALYQGGKLVAVKLSSEIITIGENSAAHFDGIITAASEADQLKVFVCGPDKSLLPLCEAVQINLSNTDE